MLPDHVAIIMDGNGRWARERLRPRIYGHIKGARVAKKVITDAVKLGLKNLTLYAFSTENWARPVDEVNFLMRLLGRYLARERQQLVAQNIRFKVIGKYRELPPAIVEEISKTIELTKNNTGLNLTFALNYGGRQELVSLFQGIVNEVEAGRLKASDLTEQHITKKLEESSVGDVDLIIRTSGEQRLSNFLTWQSAYSEFYFLETLWPDFTEGQFREALRVFRNRERRFGKISEQLHRQDGDQIRTL